MKKFRTSCEFCIFSKKENSKQVGCELNRIEKFIEKEEASLVNNHYEIERFCNTCRQENISKENILKEVEIKYSVIVNGYENNYWNVLKKILNLELKPYSVYVVIDKRFDINLYKEFQYEYNKKDVKLLFKQFLIQTDFDEAIDEIVFKNETQFFIPVFDEINFDPTYYNKLINYDLEKINALIKKDFYGSLISTVLYKIVKGNKDRPFLEKIKELKETKPDKEASTLWIE